MKVQGEFKMQAHSISGVVMDIAAFKVSHSVKEDKYATTALRSGVVIDVAVFKVRHSSNIDATALRIVRARSSSIGAMDEISGKVQNASTHILRRQNHEHAHISRSVQEGQFKGAMDESSGKVQRCKHRKSSGVVMDIAAIKVSHSVARNIDATALQAKKRSA